MSGEFFQYELPAELVAQAPSAIRDQSRLLVVDRRHGKIEDKRFSDILSYIPAGDALVLNDTRVFPARLLGKEATGGKVDILLLNPYVKPLTRTDETMSAGEAEEWKSKILWKCLIQPALKEGQAVHFEGETVQAIFMRRDLDGVPIVEFKDVDPLELARKIGRMPLPPYIKREDAASDAERYQTVFAKNEGAVAAPTAGLHFTPPILEEARRKGIEVVMLTLHVGYGTFKPVEDPANHKMHVERFEVSPEAAEKLNCVKAAGKKIWAVGTTSVRTLETCVMERKIIPGKGETDILIRAPFEFEAVDHLITNFHLPKTTLLWLVGAFMGNPLLKKAYEHAIREKYRFYSYGDAMLIL